MERDETMNLRVRLVRTLLICMGTALPSLAEAQSSTGIPPAITTPDKLESRIGTLEFKDGAPSAATVEKAFDTMNFTHALDAFLNSYGGHPLMRSARGFSASGRTTTRFSSFRT
jgi:hypothetical protein